jgi:Fic family protein
MPPRALVEVLDALQAQFEVHPEGLRIEQIAELNRDVPRRTLQRHLARLVEMGRLDAVGQASARRYLPAPPSRGGHTPPGNVAPRSSWQTREGAEVERLVNRPLSQRIPVGYRREFLERYSPNETAFLPSSLRNRLHTLGRSPEGERPAGTYARQIMGRLLIDLSWASSHLEGNTYTRLDTQNLIEFGQLAEGRDQREAQMILNHKAAIEMLVEDVENVAFNRYTLLNLHAILADNLLTDPAAGGRLRTIPVNITGTSYQPTGVPQLIEECFDLILAKATAITDPFEQAFFVMVHVPYLQPFEDVNKRVSRLAANIPLFKSNLAPLSFVDIPMQSYVDAILGVYETTRVDLLRDLFVWAYERSCQRYTVLKDALPQPDPLRLRYRAVLTEMVRETVKEGDPIDARRLRGRGRGLVDQADLDTVVAMALNELHRLHEGNIARFGLRLSKFRVWAPRRG